MGEKPAAEPDDPQLWLFVQLSVRLNKKGLNFLTAMIASGTTNGKAANVATTAISYGG